MKQIEVNTTQNVTIQYELASLKERIFAFVGDFALLFMSVFFLFIILLAIAGENSADNILYLVIFPIFFFFSLVVEYFMNGQSPGKKMQKLKIIKLNGKQPQLNDYIIRWAFRSLDIYFSFGTVASILIGSSKKAQRLGDVLANTVVVKIKPTHDFKMTDLMKLQSIDNYEATYPSVKRLSEEELLLIKEVLDRYKAYPNDGHRDVVFRVSETLCKKLEIEEVPKNRIVFLNTLIKDYVMITR